MLNENGVLVGMAVLRWDGCMGEKCVYTSHQSLGCKRQTSAKNKMHVLFSYSFIFVMRHIRFRVPRFFVSISAFFFFFSFVRLFIPFGFSSLHFVRFSVIVVAVYVCDCVCV